MPDTTPLFVILGGFLALVGAALMWVAIEVRRD